MVAVKCDYIMTAISCNAEVIVKFFLIVWFYSMNINGKNGLNNSRCKNSSVRQNPKSNIFMTGPNL